MNTKKTTQKCNSCGEIFNENEMTKTQMIVEDVVDYYEKNIFYCKDCRHKIKEDRENNNYYLLSNWGY